MIRPLLAAALLALLTGCGDGQPFVFEEEVPGGTPDDGEAGLPPGTPSPRADAPIARFETPDEAGGGVVRSVTLNAAAQTLTVDNLAFDGTAPYRRDGVIPTLAGHAVFRSEETVEDRVTRQRIGQLDYRAIHGVSPDRVTVDGRRVPASRFAIVRSGDFMNYGFGGFLYERNDRVILPESRTGQAVFDGGYAGTRIFKGRAGQEMVEGEMRIAVDFTDFNDSDGVAGVIYNRRAFDARTGAPVAVNTRGIRREDAAGTPILDLPDAHFVLSAGSTTRAGEILGRIDSTVEVDGRRQMYEQGSYNGIIGGDLNRGGEVVGVVVMTSEDPRFEGVQAQETGGFILQRDLAGR